jgi:Icc-related predicted phosphoesterase
MSDQRVTRVLCAADPQGSTEAIERLLKTVAERDVDAIVLIGDLSAGGGDRQASYRALFRALGAADRPVYWVPGPGDAPVEEYLQEAHNMEVVHPQLHGVHGTVAFTPDGHVLVAGLGGEVSDDADAHRDEQERLRYPRWEAEYRLKMIQELSEHQLMLLLATPPAHRGLERSGSEVLAELVNTFRPRLVVTGGERGSEMLGRSLVVAPGSLAEGHYAIADLHDRKVELQELAAV